ncbi:MAG: phosphate ABC transporter permease PstA [Planctomycetota bacterium]|nr:MAG: phosphate ABC transporter permease PstA [Planctomycetota bacterium]
MVWLTAGSLCLALAMIAGLLVLVVAEGAASFWPHEVVQVELDGGRKLMGEVTVTETYRPEESALDGLGAAARERAQRELAAQSGAARRRMLRIGNYELTGEHFAWVSDFQQAPGGESRPAWALVIERRAWGRFYGVPASYRVDEQVVETDPARIVQRVEDEHSGALERHAAIRALERDEIGAVNARQEAARLAVRKAELEHGLRSAQRTEAERELARVTAECETQFGEIQQRIRELRRANSGQQLVLRTADGHEQPIELGQIVRAYPANQLGLGGSLAVYLSRWREFLLDEPRESNSEGGVLPAIFGTVVMTLLMSLAVVPFGVLAALYLREYAKPGLIVSVVRIAVNNLAGVPSIVFGVFGLGFFCYIVGANIDDLFYSERLPNPTFGKGGVLWSALTLALLTLPVVIVATEEALAAVPGSMREGSYACGATKWQTIQRIVLPRALPGIMTGMILAIARGAGEVAPLMLVGAVKLAPQLPIDGSFPFLHPERSFMHLGFHIYDLGFQSQNSEAAKPMVYTTTLLLIGIIVLLNIAAIVVRARLRRRFLAGSI